MPSRPNVLVLAHGDLYQTVFPTTRRLLNAERLRRIPEGAVVISTARGAVITEHLSWTQ